MYFIQKEQLQPPNLAGNLEDHISALNYLTNQEKSKMIKYEYGVKKTEKVVSM